MININIFTLIHPYNEKLIQLLLFFLLVIVSLNASSRSDAAIHFEQGLLFFNAEQYEMAANEFKQAVTIQPENSEFHHALGKAYGKIAQHSGWMDAMKYSRLTQQEFELAVELDNQNIAALEDLKTYYTEAPFFLGGGQEKAEEVQKKIDSLERIN